MDRLELMRTSRSADLYGFSLDYLVPKREDRGLTRSQMARLCGVHPSTIKRLEEGTIGPKDYPSAMVYAGHYGLSQAVTAEWLSLLFGIKRIFPGPAVGGWLIPELPWKPSGLTDEFKRYFRLDGSRIVFRDGSGLTEVADNLWKYLNHRVQPEVYRDSAALVPHLVSVITGNEAIPKEDIQAYCLSMGLDVHERVDFKLAWAADLLKYHPREVQHVSAVVAAHTDWHLSFLDTEERQALEERFTDLQEKERSLVGGTVLLHLRGVL